MGQKQKTERDKKEKRMNDGNNNGQPTHGARKHAWRMQAAWANHLFVSTPKLIQKLPKVVSIFIIYSALKIEYFSSFLPTPRMILCL